MKVNINIVQSKTEDSKVDKNIETFINDKLNKLSVIHDGIINSNVTLKTENVGNDENKIVEIKLQIKGNDLFAKKQSKTFEEATDIAVDALRKQLTKYKDKIQNKRK